ncbi:MAG: hypothetical protein ACI9BF_000232 [Candidatus Paceibacteria bacterium]|jgi:hypothetical protein
MINFYSQKHLSQAAVYALGTSFAVLASMATVFFVAEPAISYGQTDVFTIKQTITGESSFKVTAPDVTMAGSISGLTGGNATGTTQFVVLTNSSAGYSVTIDFFNNAGAQAMLGDTSASQSIVDYVGSTMQPEYDFTTTASAQLAYTVTASSSDDLDASFLDNGAACGSGGSGMNGRCWMAPSTTDFMIMDTTAAELAGATSTITFKVHVPNSASPALTADTYTATATLTLITK